MTVRSGLIALVVLGVVSCLGQGAVALVQTRDSRDLSDRLLLDLRLAQAASDADMRHDGLLAVARGALLAGPGADDAQRRSLRADAEAAGRQLLANLQTVQSQADDEELRRRAADVRPVAERYAQSARTLVDAALSKAGADDAARRAFEDDFKTLEGGLEKLGERIEARATVRIDERDALIARHRALALAALLAALAALAGYGAWFGRRLLARLGAEPQALDSFAQRIAAGELDAEFQPPRPGETSVAGAMVAMRDRLRGTVVAIRRGADDVATAAAEIASGSQDLSQRTEQQAGSLQSTASSMEQMAGSLNQTAEHARQARLLADGASEVAGRGGDAVSRVVQTMGEIQDSSRRIAEITNVIDSIAFQTNILALNASVEAARAGEQGRGFAVVAGEVRSLAQRSADAARQIKGLIASSVERVDAGHRLVADAGRTMGEIVTQVRHVHDLIGEITVASAEQTAGIAVVNHSVAELDQGTQHNAALVEESAAAARMLADQARRLAQAVGEFRLSAG